MLDAHPELKDLTSEALASPAAHKKTDEDNNLGRLLFPELESSQLVEFDRSAASLLTLEWVLLDDYESFTECQPVATKLSRKSFNLLRAYTQSVLETPEDIQAMKVFLAINDLGKIKSVADQVSQGLNIDEVDHDEILRLALTHYPELSPGFQSLPESHQDMVLKGLATQFNLAQFMQAENVPANLSKLKHVDEKTLHFYLMHTLYDIAGAQGHVTQKGSQVMTETTFRNFEAAIKSVDGLTKGKSEVEVYNDYLHHACPVEVDLAKPDEYMLARLCGMMRITNTWQAVALQAVVTNLPEQTRNVLKKALNKTGIDDGTALLAYYSPAFLRNINLASNPNNFSEAITVGLTTLANTIQIARRHIVDRKENGVCTLFIHDIATAAKNGSDGLKDVRVGVRKKGKDLEAVIEPSPEIDVGKFPHQALEAIPGKKVAIIGMGGGSDVVQAGILGKLLEQQGGKESPIVVSIRSKYTRSQDTQGVMNVLRTIENPGEQIASGVYLVTPASSGSGRFVENVPAGDMTTILVIEEEGQLHTQLQAISDRFGIDTVIALDTGGDALETLPNPASQDARSLTAISRLQNVEKLSCEIATGIDAPLNAENVLLAAEATYFDPNQEAIDLILKTYRKWGFDGSQPSLYGKTAFAWQQALRGRRGITEIPLPSRVIADDNNPWTPYVDIRRATRGIFIMKLEKHIDAILTPSSR